ncbi:MAG: hypothetical protein ABIN79_07350 [Marmoricola sp.]
MKIPTSKVSARGPLVAVSVLLVAAATACGGSSPTASAPSSSTPSSSSSTAAPGTSTAPTVAPVPVEKNPPGDIPDNLAFVKYANNAGGYAFTHPEGWARTGGGTKVQFTDKLNGVNVDSVPATQAPTVASARQNEIPRLQKSVPAFALRDVSTVTLPGGKGVHIVFRRNSEPDPVTGKVFRDEVEEYAVFSAGRLVRMDLYGPVGADNVDAYRTMSQSLILR